MVRGAQFCEQTESHWLYNLNRGIVWYINIHLGRVVILEKKKNKISKGQSCQELSLDLKCACRLHAFITSCRFLAYLFLVTAPLPTTKC